MVRRLVYVVGADESVRLQCCAELVRNNNKANNKAIVTESPSTLKDTIGSFLPLEKIDVAILRSHTVNDLNHDKIDELKKENASVVFIKESVGHLMDKSKELEKLLKKHQVDYAVVDDADYYYWDWIDVLKEQDKNIIPN